MKEQFVKLKLSPIALEADIETCTLQGPSLTHHRGMTGYASPLTEINPSKTIAKDMKGMYMVMLHDVPGVLIMGPKCLHFPNRERSEEVDVRKDLVDTIRRW